MRSFFEKYGDKEITLFRKTRLSFSFKPYFAAQGALVLLLVITSLFITGNLLFPNPGVDQSSVIKQVAVKRTSAIVASGQPVKWTMIVKRSDITSNQNLIKLPKNAANIQIKTINNDQAVAILSSGAPQNQLTPSERQMLAANLLKPGKGFFAKATQFLFADLEQAASDVVEQIAGQLIQPSADQPAIIDAPDASYVDLADQAPAEAPIETTTEPAPEVTEPPVETPAEPIIETTSPSDQAPTVIEETPASEPDTANTDDNVQIDFETPAPQITQQDTDSGKLVTVSAPNEDPQSPLTDVLAYTNIPEIFKVGQESKIKIKWQNENDQDVTFHAYDTNNNGKLDYVEWTVPHLSEQTFEIIFISKAFRLDSDKNILEDVYDQVATKDGNWATFNNGEYIRVTFYHPLDNTKDNTIYARPTNAGQAAQIEVYPVYSDADGNQTEGEKVATFQNISAESAYKVLLTNLQTPTDTFDLKVIGNVDIDYIVDPAGMLVKYGSFTKPVSGCGVSDPIGVTGVGFQPKVVMFFGNDSAADGTTTNAREFFGAATSSSARAAIAAAGPNGGANPNKRKWFSNALAIANITEGATATLNTSADFVSMDADGFTLNWTVCDATARIVNYIAIGGTDVTNTYVGSFTTPTAVNHTFGVTAPGFKPDALIFFDNTLTTTNLATGDAASSVFSMGFATSAAKQNNRTSNRTTAASTTYSYQRTDSVINSVSGAGAVSRAASLVSLDTNGFTLDFTIAPANAVYVNYIALKGGQYDVGSFNQATTTGEQTVTTGFQPSAVLFQSGGYAATTSITSGSRLSFGVGISSSSRASIWSGDNAAANPSVTNQDLDRTRCLKTITPGASPTVTSSMDFVSNDATAFRVNNTIADATSRQILYLAMGSNPVTSATMASAADQTFAKNDPSTVISDITISDSSTPTITATNGIRLKIPAGLNAVWDQTVTSASASGTAVSAGKMSATPAVEYDSTTSAYVHVAADFLASNAVTISGLKLTTFSAASTTSNLGLVVAGAGQTVVANDTKAKVIGAPIISSGANQTFAVGASATTISTITITDDATNHAISATNDIRIKIPSGLNMEWDQTVTTATLGGTASAKASATVSYDDATTLKVDITSDFANGQTLTIAGLKFTTFTASSAHNLQFIVSGNKANTATAADDKTVTITGLPAMVSGANQTFVAGSSATTMSQITITDNSTSPAITAVGDIRIKIPAAFNMAWDTSVLRPTIGGAAAGKINTGVDVTYEDSNHTLVIPVTSDFAASDSITVDGGKFLATASSTSSNLGLVVSGTGGSPIVNDTKTITVVAPSISSAANQTFAKNDPSTAVSNIVVTDAATATITSASGIRIKIPAGLHAVWDQTITSATASGTAVDAGKMSATPAVEYDNATTAYVHVASNFTNGNVAVISGLKLTTFSAASSASSLQLIIAGAGGSAVATDDKTKAIGAPTISSAAIQTFSVNQSPTTISTITVTDDATNHAITAANDIRIKIPTGFHMIWDTSIGTATLGGTASAKASTTVTYDGTSTLIIDVTSDFANGQTLTIDGLKFKTFSAASTANNLQLIVSGNSANTATASDDKTITISAGFTAYDDCGGTTAGVLSTGNVTNYGFGNTGHLLNYADGSDTGVTIAFADNLNANTLLNIGPETAVPPVTAAPGGTPMFTEFGNIINMGYVTASGTSAGQAGSFTVTFSGLPASTFTLVAAGIRADSTFTRPAKFVVSNVTAGFTNASPAGTTISTTTLTNDSTTYNTGYNSVDGYVAKWTSLTPVGGTIILTVKTDTPISKIYLNALKLVQEGVSSTPLTMVSGSNQSFVVGDSSTTAAQITVTDASDTPVITALNDLRVKIPAGFNMTWDNSIKRPTIGGGASGKINTGVDVTYEDSDHTVVIPVTSDFVASDSITIDGLKFNNFSNTSTASNMVLIVAGSGGATAATDTKTITITGPSATFSNQANVAATFLPDTASQYFGTFKIAGTGTVSAITLTQYGNDSVAGTDFSNIKLVADDGNGVYNSATDTTVLGTVSTFTANKAAFSGLSIAAGSSTYVHVLVDVTDLIIPLPAPTAGVEILAGTDITSTATVAGSFPVTMGTSTLTAVYPYLENVETTSIEIAWSSSTSTATGSVAYGATSSYGTTVNETVTPVAVNSTTLYEHEIVLTGLSTNATYHYQVTDGSGTKSADSTFKTAPAAGTAFNFTVGGDVATNADSPSSAFWNNSNIISNAADADPTNPKTIFFFTGDHTMGGGDTEWQGQFFLPYRNQTKNAVLYNVYGNHDTGGSSPTTFPKYFDAPTDGNSNNNYYYSFNYGNTHFIILDSNAGNGAGSAQRNWAIADLASSAATGAKWRIAMIHVPPYSWSTAPTGHSPDSGLIDLMDNVLAVGNVDLIFNGHTHIYQRVFKPETSLGKKGMTQIVTGGGGATLTTAPTEADLLACGIPCATYPYLEYMHNGFHYLVVEAGADRLKVTARDTTNSIFDTFYVPRLPAISSGASTNFALGAGSTTISPITITDDATVPLIRADNTTGDISIKIPSGLDMIWDNTIATATISGTNASKVASSSNVTYDGTNKIATINVTTDFVAGDTVTISGLKAKNFNSTTSGQFSLLAEGPTGVVDATDDKTMTIGASVPTQTITNVGGDASAPYLTSDNTPLITLTLSANGDCRAATSAKSYDNMSGDTDCTGDGTTSISCQMPLISDSASATVYTACEDNTQAYKDTAGTATTISFQLDSVVPTTTDNFTHNASWQSGNQTITLTPTDAAPSSSIAWTKYCTSGSGCNPSGGTAYTVPVVISIEGTSYFNYASQDNAGNTQTTVSKTVMIDTAVPTTVAGGSNGYAFGTSWTNQNVTVTLTCGDGSGSGCGATLYCAGSNSCTPSTPYIQGVTTVTVSTAGTSYVRYYSTDAVNNTETVKSQTINIDKNGPSVNAGVDESKKAIFTQDATVSAGSSGIASYLWSKVSGPGAITFGTATTEDTTVTAGQEGTYIIRLTVTDNASTAVYDEFTLVWDTTNPVANAGADQIKKTQFTQTGSATDTGGSGVASYSWSKVSGPGAINFGTSTTAQTTISVDTDGSYVIRLTATDNATNSGTDDFTLIWDATVPTTTDNFTHNDSWQSTSQTITLTPTDPAPSSSIAWTKYCTSSISCDPSTGTAYTVPVSISTEGISYFRYASQDNAGNTQTTVTKTVKIDTTAPTTVASGSNGYNFSTNWSSQDVTVTLTCGDGGGSPCGVTLYCTTSNACTPNLSYNPSSKPVISTLGTSYIRYYSTDAMNNPETVVMQTINIDKTTPTATDDYGAKDGVWQNSNQTITLTPGDVGGSGLAAVYYCRDTANTCNPTTGGAILSSPYAVSLSEGLNGPDSYFRYAAKDAAGNTQTTVSKSIKIDTTPPDVSARADRTEASTFTQVGDIYEAGSGIASYLWTEVSGPGIVTFGSADAESTTITADTDGDYVISLTVVDNVGNSATASFNLKWGVINHSNNPVGGSGSLYTPPSSAPAPQTPPETPAEQTNTITQQITQLTQQVAELLGIQPPAPQITYPPINESVPQETPEALQNLQVMSVNPLGDLNIAPVQSDIGFFADKLPQLKETLESLNIDTGKPADVEKLNQTELYLPGLTATVLPSSAETNPEGQNIGSAAPVDAIPLVQLSASAINNIPTNMVFARTAGELIDFSPSLIIDAKGNAEQKITAISGQPLQLVIKPANPASRVTGLMTLTHPLTTLSKPHRNILAQLFGAALAAAQQPLEQSQSSALSGLLVQKFDYSEVRPGVFEAKINAPTAGGEYQVTTVVEYKDKSITPTETKMTTVVDPEGYVYKQTADGKLRIENASVSLYWLNPSKKEYELWPAERFLQKNPSLTDDTGKYSFMVPQGEYYLTVSAPGYASFKGNAFSVKEDNGVKLDIELKKINILPGWANWQLLVSVLLFIFVIILICILVYIKSHG